MPQAHGPLSKFVPTDKRRSNRQTGQEQKAMAMTLNAVFGGEVRKRLLMLLGLDQHLPSGRSRSLTAGSARFMARRRMSFMRVCQPGPPERRKSKTSGSSRAVI